MEIASSIHMYVDDNALVPRGNWLFSPNPPMAHEVFESLLDAWFKSDAVQAIADVNDAVLSKLPEADRNVAHAPIKRLMDVRVGNDAKGVRLGTFSNQGSVAAGGNQLTGTNTSLFMLPQTVQVEDVVMEGDTENETGEVVAPPPAVALENTIDTMRSMTGRASGKDYDVTLMQICMDIDPAYLNKFIDALYRQNMGYTVLNLRWRTVDPLDRATNGFVYGETQVIEVDMLIEGLLFRDWTKPLMPQSVRTALSIPPDAPPQQ
jgi:hypothetical protein